MKLIKIHSFDCPICAEIGDKYVALAEREGWDHQTVELEQLAAVESDLRTYVVNYHLEGGGMVDIPIVVIETAEGEIQASSVVKNLTEIDNLIQSWKLWESSQKR